MQRAEDNGVNEATIKPDMSVDEGQFCETTRRVVMVSPLPASVRSLFVALTIRCYDVLVFHHEFDPILQTIESDLIILDRTTKRITSTQPESNLAKTTTTPVLLLYRNGEDIVPDGDNLIWPCSVEKAIDTIEGIIARNQPSPTTLGSELLKVKDVVVDLKRITVRKAGSKVELTKTEFDLLKGLLLNGGGVMTRQQLMTFVWGDSYFGGSNSVDVHIKSLRHKLGDDPKNPQYVATVRGIGYRIAD